MYWKLAPLSSTDNNKKVYSLIHLQIIHCVFKPGHPFFVIKKWSHNHTLVCSLERSQILVVFVEIVEISFRASDVNSPVDVNSPLFGFCQLNSTNMENMS